MTILPGAIEFPNNAIELITARLPTYVDPDLGVFKRPLRATDPTQSVGVFPSTKLPDRTTIEMPSLEPTLKTYNIILQSIVHDTDEQACISVHTILVNRLWRMLYRDPALDAGLTALSVVADNSIERIQRRGVTLVRYLSNEVTGTFFQTAWLEFWLETETVGVS